MDSVSIIEGFYGVNVGSCGHQKVSSIDMDDWILLVWQDELLEIMEGQVVVS